MNSQISIIGCGWLGLPLAKHLISVGYSIKGSTTSKDNLNTLQNASIDGYVISLNEEGINGDFTNFLSGSATVIINIPPGLRKQPNKNHVAEIQHLVRAIEKQHIKNVLYISSTSVFKDEENFPLIDAATLPNSTSNNGMQLMEIEQLLRANTSFNTTILRFGGLFDSSRHPAKYLSGRTNLSNAKAPINLIHKDDCIAIIHSILKNKHWNDLFNAAHPSHPNKKSYYTNYCKTNNLELPKFNLEAKSKGKLIDSSKMVQLLKYTFKQAP